jgi:phosphoribosylaminoimidazole carboxylase PurE protein
LFKGGEVAKERVAILIGSKSDLEIMAEARDVLIEKSVECELFISSAHRDPDGTREIVKKEEKQGCRLFIAGAGLAGHLPGFVASQTNLPVIGVPISAGPLKGIDAVLSMVQMPRGVPVAVVGIDNARNAALLALRILGKL